MIILSAINDSIFSVFTIFLPLIYSVLSYITVQEHQYTIAKLLHRLVQRPRKYNIVVNFGIQQVWIEFKLCDLIPLVLCGLLTCLNLVFSFIKWDNHGIYLEELSLELNQLLYVNHLDQYLTHNTSIISISYQQQQLQK